MKRFESIVALLLTVCMVISSSVVPVFAASTIRITFAADEEQMLSNNITGDPATVYTLKVSANEAFSAFGFILSYDTTKIQPVKVNPVRKMYADVTPADGVAEEVESMSLLAKVQFPAYEDAWGDQVTPEPVPYDNEYKIATAGNRKGLYVTISTAETDLSTTKGQEIMTFTYRYISGEPSKGDLRLEIDKDSAVFDVLGLSDDSDKAKGLVVLDAAKIQYSAWAGDLSYSFSYTGSDKITLGALELEADEPAIKVNGSLDKANHVVELTLTAKDTDGGAMTLPADTTYEFDAGTTTASLSDDGTTITIPKNSPAGTIAVKAVSSDGTVESNEVTIAVTRAASKVITVELSGGGVTAGGDLTIDGTEEKTLQASAYDQFGGKIDVEWSAVPDKNTYKGVSIDEDGVITVEKDASKGNYKITAEDENGTQKGETLTVIRANTTVATVITLNGAAEIDVPKVNWDSGAIDASCSESYTVSAENIYGDEVDVDADEITWSVTEGAKGVSIADGTLTVTNKAEQGSVVITAKYGTLTATKTVQLKKDNNIRAAAVKLEESTVTVDGKNGAETTAKAYDQYGNPIDSGTWSVNDGGNNVSIKNGKITVAKDAAEGSYTISVDNLLGGTVSATLTVVRANKDKAVDFTIAGLTEIAVPEFNQSSGCGMTQVNYSVDEESVYNIYSDIIDNFDPSKLAWSVTKADGTSVDVGVTMSGGVLYVRNTAQAGTVYVHATYDDVTKTLPVTLTKEASVATMMLLSPSEVTVNGSLAPAGATVDVTVSDQYLSVMHQANVSVEADKGATVSGDKITVDAFAPAGTITVTVEGLTKNLTVKRADSVPYAVKFDMESDTIKIGNTKEYTAKVYDQFGENLGYTNEQLTWSVLDNKKVSVVNGKVTVALDAEIDSPATIQAAYGDLTDTLTITVADKSPLYVKAADGSTVQEFAYDKTAKEFKTNIFAVYTDADYKNPIDLSTLDIKVTYGESAEAPTDAGTYDVTVTWENNEYRGTAKGTLVIDPIEVAIPTAETGLVYNGNPQIGVAAGDLYSVENGTKTNAGNYTATATLKDSKNYVWADDTAEPKFIPWSIAKDKITVDGILWDYTTPLKYNEAEQTIEIFVMPAGVTVVSYENATKTDAGTYIAVANLAAVDSENYELTASTVMQEWTIDPKPITVDLDWNYSSKFEYDGNEKTVTLTIVGEHANKFDISYVDNAKTDAGKYIAIATLALKAEFDKNYDFIGVDDEALKCEWEISRKEIAVPTAKTDLVYTSTEQTGVDEGEGYTLTGATATDADTYTATATLDKNHCWTGGSTDSKNISWSIAKAPITVTVTAADKVYDGKTDADLTVVFDGLVNGETVAEGTDYNVTTAAFADKNVGEDKKVNFQIDYAGRFNESGNYAMPLTARVIKPACIGTTTADITPADWTAPAVSDQVIKVGKTLDDLKAQLGTFTVNGVNSEVIDITYELTCADGEFAKAAGDTDVVEIAFTLTGANAANYAPASKTDTFKVKINELDSQVVSFANTSVEKTYGDVALTMTATNSSEDGGAFSYESDNTDVATVDAATGEVTIKGAGTAKITATAARVEGKWAATPVSYTLTVAKKAVTVTADNKSKTYGEENPALTMTVPADALVGADTEAALGVTLTTTAQKDSDVATYAITGTSTSANYDVTVTPGVLTVEKKGIDAPTAKTGLVYNGSAQTGVEAGEGYDLSGNTETNAGTYTATATINSNYKWNDADFDSEIEWSIAQAPEKTFADQTVTAYSKMVTTEDQVFTVSLADAIAELGTDAKIKAVLAAVGSDANISAKEDGSDVVITVKPTEAAEEAAGFAVILSSKNYEDSAVAINVTVVDKTDVSTKITFGNKTVIWNGEAKALAAAKFNGTASGTGKITYSVDGATWSETMPTFTDAGAYTVTAKYEDDTQMGTTTAVLTITNKLDVTVTVTDSKDETFVNNGKYKVTYVENAKDANEAEVIVKGTKALTAYTSTDASQAADKHKWIGLLIETAVNGEASTNLYYSADGETFEKLDASEFTASNQHGGNGKQFVLWIATDENDEITRWIATDTEGTDALELNIEFTAGGKPSSGSGSGSGTSGSISSSLDEKKAQKVEDMIDEIGRVTLDDEELIKDAREAYDKLTKKQKKLVDNYDELVEAEKKLEKLLEAQGDLPFTDVDEDDDIYDAVKFVYDNGLMVGVGDGTMFAPEAGLTRAMIARILHAYEGEPAAAASAFTDVARGMWYTAAIDWAAANKVVSGYGNGLYGPNDTLTREQLAVIMYYYAQSKGYDVSAGLDTNILSYNDAFSISSWAMPAMQWACAEDILTDANGFICPTAAATRADVAEAFMAFMLRYEK